MWGADAVALGGRETLDFGEYKETWGVVLLLLGTLGGIFEGLETAKCQFGDWMSLRNFGGQFFEYRKPHFFAHPETWGVFLALAETPIAF